MEKKIKQFFFFFFPFSMKKSTNSTNLDKGDEGENSAAKAEALFQLGREEHSKKNFSRARKYFEEAAAMDHASAIFNLGVYLSKEDAVKAAEYYEKAANLGHAKAQNNLGVCYELGTGVPKDVGLAAQWYRKAADQGNQSAIESLKKMGLEKVKKKKKKDVEALSFFCFLL